MSLVNSSPLFLELIKPANLLAIVFDNQSYASMGPTATAGTADLEKIAKGAGIQTTGTIHSEDQFKLLVKESLESQGLGFFVVKAEPGKARVDVDSRRLHGRAMKETFVESLLRHPDYPKKLPTRGSM